jgi:hypothetical protein
MVCCAVLCKVWREGQAKRVWIYRLLMAGSIEEKVLQRQLAKQGLSEALVDEVGQEVSRLVGRSGAVRYSRASVRHWWTWSGRR